MWGLGMQLTQSYARPSAGAMLPDGMRLNVSAERSRPPVHLTAMVRDSMAYARLMLALYEVVTGDLRNRPKDHSAYQAWVEQRYLEELGEELRERAAGLPDLLKQRAELAARISPLRNRANALEQKAYGAQFNIKKYEYFGWLRKHDIKAWVALDPVVSVHPDCLIFEVFSQDESSYGRVTVPTSSLDVFGAPAYGTTNIDYSRALADEIRRIRSYRPAFLEIGAEGVSVATGAGEAIEKKIDLPPTWVRGFLQVQSAAAFGAVDLSLSAATMAEVLSLLRRRETEGPRSLRFVIAPGERPVIVVEPWNEEVREAAHIYTGSYRGEIRIWGRRRLFVLESLLPHADRVQVRLLGGGMPSYWTVFQGEQRFDLGLSGWTKNDWAQAARFDLLATTATAPPELVQRALAALTAALHLTPDALAAQLAVPRDAAAAALQGCCAQGQAMYDHITGEYRWRAMLPIPLQLEPTEQDRRMAQARRIVNARGVEWQEVDPTEEAFGAPQLAADYVRVRAMVRDDARSRSELRATLDVDLDGRIQYAHCTCHMFRRDRLRKGPCAHILAAGALASERVAVERAKGAESSARGLDPNRFAGQTFVFTGALTLFTREQAEELVRQAGGTASGSVSKNTTYLVAGDRAGSKLAKAQQLGVSVLTEAQFQAMIEGRP
jgi:hypothetical protein